MKGIPLLPGLHTKHYTIQLPAELIVRLAKEPIGSGGWQTLMNDVRMHVDGNTLELPESLIHRLVSHAVKFGSGGYQGVIRWILCLLLEQHATAILGTPQTIKGKSKVA